MKRPETSAGGFMLCFLPVNINSNMPAPTGGALYVRRAASLGGSREVA